MNENSPNSEETRAPTWFRNARRVLGCFTFPGRDPRRLVKNRSGIPSSFRDMIEEERAILPKSFTGSASPVQDAAK